jgi:hypothetical protein
MPLHPQVRATRLRELPLVWASFFSAAALSISLFTDHCPTFIGVGGGGGLGGVWGEFDFCQALGSQGKGAGGRRVFSFSPLVPADVVCGLSTTA